MRGRGASPPVTEAQARLDVWLWRARMAKTRALCAGLVAGGHVRLNGRKIDTPGRAVKAGDVLTVALDRTVRVLRVVALGGRRGPASEAQALYQQLDETATRSVLAPPTQSG